MATTKEDDKGRVAIEEEQVEGQLDNQAISQLCEQHCGGVKAERKQTVDCTTQDFDDGSGKAFMAEKSCQSINQQAHHFKGN